MDNYKYIEDTYGTKFEVGMRVKHSEKKEHAFGVVAKPDGSNLHYVMVRFDNLDHDRPCHPSEVMILPEGSKDIKVLDGKSEIVAYFRNYVIDGAGVQEISRRSNTVISVADTFQTITILDDFVECEINLGTDVEIASRSAFDLHLMVNGKKVIVDFDGWSIVIERQKAA